MDLLSLLAENFDLPILDWIAANLWCPFLDAVRPVVTRLGDAGLFWIAIAVIVLLVLIGGAVVITVLLLLLRKYRK